MTQDYRVSLTLSRRAQRLSKKVQKIRVDGVEQILQKHSECARACYSERAARGGKHLSCKRNTLARRHPTMASTVTR